MFHDVSINISYRVNKSQLLALIALNPNVGNYYFFNYNF
jgi:hypothetical protein